MYSSRLISGPLSVVVLVAVVALAVAVEVAASVEAIWYAVECRYSLDIVLDVSFSLGRRW